MFLILLIYFPKFSIVLHGLLVLLQATTLNVAINSRNKTLITVVMSNNVSIQIMVS